MDTSVGVLHTLWDLRLFVIIFSRSTGPLKGSGWTTRLATVGKIPLLPLPVMVHRRAGGGSSPLCEAGARGGAWQGPFPERLEPDGSTEPNSRQGALLHHARLPCVSSQGQSADGGRRAAQGSGPANSAAPTLTLRAEVGDTV